MSSHCHLECTTSHAKTATWHHIEAGYAPTQLTVRWYAFATFTILTSGYTGYVKAQVEYSLDGGSSWTDIETAFEKTETSTGLHSYTLSMHDAQVSIPRTQDTSEIQVRATLTVQMPSCGSNCNNVSGTTGNLQVADIRVDADCQIPTDESSSSQGWNTSSPYRTTHNFQQTLTPAGTSFVNRTVREVDPVAGGGAQDTCYFAGSSIARITSVVSGAFQWTVQSGNTWGLDTVGWVEGATNYYQAYSTALPCSASGPQQMQISCLNPTDFVPYIQNTLEDGIDSTSVSSRRQTNYQERSWP